MKAIKTAIAILLMFLQRVDAQDSGAGDRSVVGKKGEVASIDQMTADRHDAALKPLLDKMQKAIDAGPYQLTPESLGKHPVPDWYADAKFGIFIHYGLFSVPAYSNRGCWYGHSMYDPNAPIWRFIRPQVPCGAYDYHRKTYGPADQFGYKDFAPSLTASSFDADQWVSLFKEAGARFVVPVACFHDGIAMWDSKLTDWNVVNFGPKRDYIGLLAAATRKQGLKFGFSWHAFKRPSFFDKRSPEDHNDIHPPNAGTPWSIYGPATVTPEFIEDSLGRLTELVDGYHPDLVWFDFDTRYVKEPNLARFAAYYFNRAAEWKQNVVINDKNKSGKAFPLHSFVLDLERGKESSLRSELWQTDTSVSWHDWSYINNDSFKTADELVRELVDIVSKNGVLLLDVGPRADGVIPPEPQAILRGIGEWLKINGEAIYGTRPCWALGFGEGPNNSGGGSFSDKGNAFSAEDFRFTQKGDVIYAIAMDWPKGVDRFLIKSLSPKSIDGSIAEVKLLGSPATLNWKLTDQGLRIELPPRPADSAAYSFAITVEGKVIKTAEPQDSPDQRTKTNSKKRTKQQQ